MLHLNGLIVCVFAAALPGEPVARAVPQDFPPRPAIAKGVLAPELAATLDAVFGTGFRPGDWNSDRLDGLTDIVDSGDVRLAWIVTDLLRMSADPAGRSYLVAAAEELLGLDASAAQPFTLFTDHLLAWDVPAPPDYLRFKRAIFRPWGEEWMRLMVPGGVDWRHVTWGGVGIDDRAFGKTDDPCSCIPAADNPEATTAAEAAWLDDSSVVFGISVGGEHRAYPRRIMEVREMVNDTLGGRDLGIPYCTLCASAQAYFTDRMPAGIARPVLRTSGLLSRSNKLMYDYVTGSVFDTFRGAALTGPLAAAGVVLPQGAVVTTTWGAWRGAHPDTTVLAEKLALGQDFDFRGGRDAKGPIFPLGRVDPRLAVQADVLGVVAVGRKPAAFPVGEALAALERGEPVELAGVQLVLVGGGLAARGADGASVVSHQAFWFAWSQFYPGTLLWAAGSKNDDEDG